MEDTLLGLADKVARGHSLTLETEPADRCISASMNETIMKAIEKAATMLGLRHMRLMSLAGHDTQSMSAITSSGMLFVPSVDGISHNPKEFTRGEDVLNGANTLLHTLLKLGSRSE
jgi:N-carbamoyl-L-amino-acid hydrolase